MSLPVASGGTELCRRSAQGSHIFILYMLYTCYTGGNQMHPHQTASKTKEEAHICSKCIVFAAGLLNA